MASVQAVCRRCGKTWTHTTARCCDNCGLEITLLEGPQPQGYPPAGPTQGFYYGFQQQQYQPQAAPGGAAPFSQGGYQGHQGGYQGEQGGYHGHRGGYQGYQGYQGQQQGSQGAGYGHRAGLSQGQPRGGFQNHNYYGNGRGRGYNQDGRGSYHGRGRGYGRGRGRGRGQTYYDQGANPSGAPINSEQDETEFFHREVPSGPRGRGGFRGSFGPAGHPQRRKRPVDDDSKLEDMEASKRSKGSGTRLDKDTTNVPKSPSKSVASNQPKSSESKEPTEPKYCLLCHVWGHWVTDECPKSGLKQDAALVRVDTLTWRPYCTVDDLETLPSQPRNLIEVRHLVHKMSLHANTFEEWVKGRDYQLFKVYKLLRAHLDPNALRSWEMLMESCADATRDYLLEFRRIILGLSNYVIHKPLAPLMIRQGMVPTVHKRGKLFFKDSEIVKCLDSVKDNADVIRLEPQEMNSSVGYLNQYRRKYRSRWNDLNITLYNVMSSPGALPKDSKIRSGYLMPLRMKIEPDLGDVDRISVDDFQLPEPIEIGLGWDGSEDLTEAHEAEE